MTKCRKPHMKKSKYDIIQKYASENQFEIPHLAVFASTLSGGLSNCPMCDSELSEYSKDRRWCGKCFHFLRYPLEYRNQLIEVRSALGLYNYPLYHFPVVFIWWSDLNGTILNMFNQP